MSAEDIFISRILEEYVGPAIEDYVWEDKNVRRVTRIAGGVFRIHTKIWRCEHLPEYRVPIPASSYFNGNFEEIIPPCLETRFVTYVPTGKVLYDTRLPRSKAIIYEYILESLLGKKDLTHG